MYLKPFGIYLVWLFTWFSGGGWENIKLEVVVQYQFEPGPLIRPLCNEIIKDLVKYGWYLKISTYVDYTNLLDIILIISSLALAGFSLYLPQS